MTFNTEQNDAVSNLAAMLESGPHELSNALADTSLLALNHILFRCLREEESASYKALTAHLSMALMHSTGR